MANPEHLKILKHGVEVWNEWRVRHKYVLVGIQPVDLSGADLSRADLFGADLRRAKVSRANLSRANLGDANLANADFTDTNLKTVDLRNANLTDATLTGADLTGADLFGANLKNANLEGIKVGGVNFSLANLSGANLSGAAFVNVNFTGADLNDTDFTDSHLSSTSFGDNDLSQAKGLETVKLYFPSSIGIDTIYKSGGNIPDVFLRGCGVPEDFITYMRSLTVQPIQFYSCFISYSHKDEEFARRLYSRMREADLRVWYAPEEMKGGRKLHEQIFNAIHLHDKLLLVLSEHSLRSGWVETEIRRARKAERDERRRKLFPIRLVDFEAIEKWECFDADSGKDLGVELREYFIPDFSNWKDHDAFEKGFARLLRDLKDDEEEKPESDPVSNDL